MSELQTTRKEVFMVAYFQVLLYADILILELPNTPHSCSQHSLDTVWLKSYWPDNNIPVPKTFTMLGVNYHSVMQGCITRPLWQSIQQQRLHTEKCVHFLLTQSLAAG